MNLKKLSLEELEQLSHADIAYELLKTSKKPMNTPKLFGEVCKLLKIDEDTMMDMIGDFYTNLTTDKRFLLLDSAEWDLKESHSVKMVIEEDEDDSSDDEEEQEEVPEETEDEAVTEESEDYDDSDEAIGDLDDLAIVTEEEMDE